MITVTEIREALARGYCFDKNSSKELDADLIEAQVDCIVDLLMPENILKIDIDPIHWMN